jgi:hypothetical protein
VEQEIAREVTEAIVHGSNISPPKVLEGIARNHDAGNNG